MCMFVQVENQSDGIIMTAAANCLKMWKKPLCQIMYEHVKSVSALLMEIIMERDLHK